MESNYTIMVQKYEALSQPRRLAVGDIIRCPGFRVGHRPEISKDPRYQVLPLIGSEGETHVAWRDSGLKAEARMRHYGDWMHATGQDTWTYTVDDSRGSAPFLVTCISLGETYGPDDIGAPFRLYRVVRCTRLRESNGYLCLDRDAERIQFLMDDPMACCSPNPDTIEIVGCAMFPIGWEYDTFSAPAPPKKIKKPGIDKRKRNTSA